MSSIWKTLSAAGAVAILSVALPGISSAVAAPLDRCEHRPTHPRCTSVSPTTTVAPGTTITTTTDSTTTTTSSPGSSGLVIPATIPYPARGSDIPYKVGGGYDIIAGHATTGTTWWVAAYWGDNGLGYTDGATWLPGDREGYRCGYGFITDGSGEDIVGRFAFVRPPEQAYGKINDKYMAEGVRYLDGSLYTGSGNEISDEDCTGVLSPIDYNGTCRDVDERPRVAFFDAAGNVLDIRDYSNTDASNVVFNLHSFDEKRVTVIACEDGLVGMIVYYDAMYGGQMAVDFSGTGPSNATFSATPDSTPSSTSGSTADVSVFTFE